MRDDKIGASNNSFDLRNLRDTIKHRIELEVWVEHLMQELAWDWNGGRLDSRK